MVVDARRSVLVSAPAGRMSQNRGTAMPPRDNRRQPASGGTIRGTLRLWLRGSIVLLLL